MAVTSRTCGHCGTEHVALELVACYRIPERREFALFLKCARCGKPSYAIAINPLEPDATPADCGTGLELCGWLIDSFGPKKPPPDIPPHVPEPAQTFFLQAVDLAANLETLDAAAIMTRRTLEAAIDAKGVAAPTLKKRIDELVEKNLVPADIAELADHIRLIGNEAAHGDQALAGNPQAQENVQELLDFTRIVLMYLFTLPRMIEKARERTQRNRPSS